MPPRRPEPTAASKARAARIAAALEGLLDDLPATPADDDPTSQDASIGGPYRPRPSGRATGQRRGVDCPGCSNPMEVDVERGIEIHRCIGCAGLWLDPGELESMVDDPGPTSADLPKLREGMKDVRVPTGPVRYRKCPRCTQVMARRNYGSHSGVVVDECRQHGMYLDPGEFEAIETFIKLGGLALERSREVRDAKRAVHRAQMEADHYRAAATATPRHDHHHGVSSWGGLFAWIEGLFSLMLLFFR